jgi:hypothetical protein
MGTAGTRPFPSFVIEEGAMLSGAPCLEHPIANIVILACLLHFQRHAPHDGRKGIEGVGVFAGVS